MKIRHFIIVYGENYTDEFGRKKIRHSNFYCLGFTEGQARQKFFHSLIWFAGLDIWISYVLG